MEISFTETEHAQYRVTQDPQGPQEGSDPCVSHLGYEGRRKGKGPLLLHTEVKGLSSTRRCTSPSWMRNDGVSVGVGFSDAVGGQLVRPEFKSRIRRFICSKPTSGRGFHSLYGSCFDTQHTETQKHVDEGHTSTRETVVPSSYGCLTRGRG